MNFHSSATVTSSSVFCIVVVINSIALTGVSLIMYYIDIYFLLIFVNFICCLSQTLRVNFPQPSIAGFNSRANGFVEIRGFLNMSFLSFFNRKFLLNNIHSYLERMSRCIIILLCIGKVQKTVSKNNLRFFVRSPINYVFYSVISLNRVLLSLKKLQPEGNIQETKKQNDFWS